MGQQLGFIGKQFNVKIHRISQKRRCLDVVFAENVFQGFFLGGGKFNVNTVLTDRLVFGCFVINIDVLDGVFGELDGFLFHIRSP